MKILYINTLYSPLIMGGAEISLKLLVEGMQAKGFEVAVLSLRPEPGLSFDMIDGVKVYRAGLKNFYWPYARDKQPAPLRLAWHMRDHTNSAMRLYVKEVIEAEKPDVVSCHNLAGWSAAVWEEIEKHQLPIVQVLHDLYLLCANSNMHKGGSACETQCLRCRLLRTGHIARSKKVAAVVGISKNILDRFITYNYFADAEKYVIHNARLITSPGAPRTRVVGQPLRIGYIGTLSQIKGVEWLIESFKSLTVDATLRIAGKGKEDYEAHVHTLADDNRIAFVGYTKPVDFFKTIDVLVVPSLWQEPLGMVVIEALANHVPVIANKVGGMQETVMHETNGLFCNDKDPSSLTLALQRLHDDPTLYNNLSAQARSSVSEILDIDRMVSAYKGVIDFVTKN